jgi:hypothetical protein
MVTEEHHSRMVTINMLESLLELLSSLFLPLWCVGKQIKQ